MKNERPKLYQQFKKNNKQLMRALKTQQDFDALAVISGHTETSFSIITNEFQQWYFGQVLQDICIIITKKNLYVLGEESDFEQLSYLNPLKRISVSFLKKSKDQDYRKQFNYVFEDIKNYINQGIPKIGMILSEPQSGSCMKSFSAFINQRGIKLIDATHFLNTTLIKQAKNRLEYFTISAKINATFMKEIYKHIENAVSQEEEIYHHQIQKRIERFKSDQLEQTKLWNRFGLKEEYKIIATSVQSGGQYDINAKDCNVNKLQGDCVIVTFACEYKQCLTFCQRTLLFEPDPYLQHIYKQVVNTQAYAIAMLKNRVKFDSVYESTKQLWFSLFEGEYKLPFPEKIGYLINEDCYIEAGNWRYIENDMYIVVRIYVQDIPAQFARYAESSKVSISIADTIVVNEDSTITSIEKELECIKYTISHENKLEKEKFQKKETQDLLTQQDIVAKEMFESVEENRMMKNQELLKMKKQYELEMRLAKQQERNDPPLLIKMEDIFALHEYPETLPKEQVFVDMENLCVFIPIRGAHCVFHIHTIKKAIVSDNKLKIAFWTNEFQVDTRKFPTNLQQNIFIKEMVIQSKDQERLFQYKEAIDSMKEEGRQAQLARQQEEDIEEFIYEKFVEVPKGFPILYDLRTRPTITPTSKSVEGHLECHQNGFRYISSRQEVIEFTFSNIRHAFYQSPEDEVIAAIHFVFKKEIKAQRKIYTQIQFYREIKGAGEQEAARKQSRYCQIDPKFDQNVQKTRLYHHQQFLDYISSSEQYIKNLFEFERPNRKKGFEGNWSKERLIFQPSKSCLINIVDHPFFILTLNDVDIMCCERVIEGTPSFDLVAVLKDLEHPVIKIDGIDLCDLKKVKKWMDENNILFFISTAGLMWRNMQFSIQKDYPLFVYEGGWSKMMKDQMEHAPVQLQDYDNQIFEPDSSQGPTSVSEFEFEDEKNKNPYLHIDANLQDNLSDIVDSEDIMSEYEDFEKSGRRKKRKIQIEIQ